MLAALLLSGALLTMSQSARPPDYTEKGLCDLWAGAQCHAARCGENAKERCTAESRRCRTATRATVTGERAQRVAECAKAMLKQKCGEPAPAECSGVDAP